jgi:hypothetical protein
MYHKARMNTNVMRMTLRTVVSLSWSLIVGLVGGWLMLSPWALGGQASGGDWTSVTRAEFFTGLGLLALAAICLIVVATQVVPVLTGGQAGGVRSSRDQARNGAAGESAELESTLVAVAQALTADLMSRGAVGGGEPSAQSSDPASHPADSRSADPSGEDR